MKNIFRSIWGNFSSMNDWMWMNVAESKKTKFRAVIELLVAVPLFIYCIHLYGRWNEVPVHTDEIEVACLMYNQPASDTVSEWRPVAKILRLARRGFQRGLPDHPDPPRARLPRGGDDARRAGEERPRGGHGRHRRLHRLATRASR